MSSYEMSTRVRLRDFILTIDDWFFSVVSYDCDFDAAGTGTGTVRGDAKRCLLRYVPDERGTRVSRWHGRAQYPKRYRKLDFNEAYEFLLQHRPEYVKDVHYVPAGDIKEVLHPEVWLPVIAERDERVALIYDLLRTHIPRNKMGITGSFLCGLNTPHSDIDFVIYGLENFNRAREVVESAKEEERSTGIAPIRDVDDHFWLQIYRKRNPALSYDEFIWHERRKKNRGVVAGTYFDILYSRDWSEMALLDPRDYEPGEKIGYRRIRCRVKDATFSFDTPAIYLVEHPEIEKVLSFTHTYVGQAEEGEWIEARGMVEKTAHETRLVVGTTREAKGEWIRRLRDSTRI